MPIHDLLQRAKKDGELVFEKNEQTQQVLSDPTAPLALPRGLAE
jgi:hypothetical protein